MTTSDYQISLHYQIAQLSSLSVDYERGELSLEGEVGCSEVQGLTTVVYGGGE